MLPLETLQAFEEFLTERTLTFEATVIGGSALVLRDLADCIALAPTAEELDDCVPWVQQQDTHPAWPAHVRATLTDLGRRLGHGF